MVGGKMETTVLEQQFKKYPLLKKGMLIDRKNINNLCSVWIVDTKPSFAASGTAKSFLNIY